MDVYLVWQYEYDDAELHGVYLHPQKAEAVVHYLAREYNAVHAVEPDEYPPMTVGTTSDGFVGYTDIHWNHRVVMSAAHVNEDKE